MTPDEAEEVAVKALGFLTSDSDRLERFANLTGWTPRALRESSGTRALLAAVLEYLADDEALLLTFAANAGLKPDSVAEASRHFKFGMGEAEGDGGDGDAGGGDGDGE